MRKSKRKQNFLASFFKGFFYGLKRLLRNAVSGLREFFIGDLERNSAQRSPKSLDLQDANFDHRNDDVMVVNRPKPFLFGLDDLPDLDVMTTKDLIAEINWNVESSEIQTAKEEDLTLLEDLLVNFPDS